MFGDIVGVFLLLFAAHHQGIVDFCLLNATEFTLTQKTHRTATFVHPINLSAREAHKEKATLSLTTFVFGQWLTYLSLKQALSQNVDVLEEVFDKKYDERT